jgi:hypothetical protein
MVRGINLVLPQVRDCFGDPRAYSSLDAWQPIEEVVGKLPASYKEFFSSYGPGVIGRFLKILHPDSLEANQSDYISQMAPLYKELNPDPIPCDIYPFSEVGAVLWALSSESDAVFLIPSVRGVWRIGVWFRQWAEWEEFTQDVPEWLAAQASGDLVIPGLPLGVHGGFVPLA